MQAIGVPGAFASAAKTASRCRFKDAFTEPRRHPAAAGWAVGMWAIQAPNPKPECNAKEDYPHALRTAVNVKQPEAPNDRKTGTPFEFGIGNERWDAVTAKAAAMRRRLQRDRPGREERTPPPVGGVRSVHCETPVSSNCSTPFVKG